MRNLKNNHNLNATVGARIPEEMHDLIRDLTNLHNYRENGNLTKGAMARYLLEIGSREFAKKLHTTKRG